MAQVLQFREAPQRMPDPGGFAETETSRDIMRTLQLAFTTGRTAMIAGRSGVGKTTTIDRFCETIASEVLRITITSGMGSPWWVASELAKPWGKDPQRNGGIEKTFDFLCDVLPGHGFKMILVDEAQYLDQRGKGKHQRGAALEWLRGLSEAAGVALVFCGDLALVDGIALFPQLESRVRTCRPVVIDKATEEDVAALAASYGILDGLEVRVLGAIARKGGALRNVTAVLDMARIFAGDEALTGEHVRIAMMDLKLDPKGGAA